MLTFKQYLAEMAGAKRGFIRKAQDAENLVVDASLSEIPDETEDHKRANRIANFIKDIILPSYTKYNPNDSITGAYDTRTRNSSKMVRQKLKIPNHQSGRRVEDIAMETASGKKYLIDLKLGPRESAGSFSANLINTTYSGTTPETKFESHNERKPNKELVNHKHPITQSSTKNKNINNLHEYFTNEIENEERNRINKGNIDDVEKIEDYVKKESHKRREEIVKKLLNVDVELPEDVKRFQVKDSTEGTKIYDTDHAWNTFKQKFEPTSYSSEVRGNTKKIFAHNKKGEKFHLLSIGVKYSNIKKGEGLDYNVKHYLIPNMENKKYGYKPHAELKH